MSGKDGANDSGKNEQTDSHRMSRRKFLKLSGATAAVAGGTGLGFFGYNAGKDPSTYTGWESYQGAAQTFDRERFAVEGSPYEIVGPTRRVDARTEVIFSRTSRLMHQWNDETGLGGLDELLRSYYAENPEHLDLDLKLRREIFPLLRSDAREYGDTFLLSRAWSNAMGAVWPEGIDEPPEIADFPSGRGFGEPSEPLPMKSPESTAKLIKQIAFQLGSVLVGITKLNPDWVYKYPMRGRGLDTEIPFDVPEHWKYAIVVGTPMSWDPMYANPNYGTSHDAYSRSRIVAYRLTAFIKQLGYPARPHTPGTEYDMMVTPVAIDAGLGEQGRHSVLITPELGSNFRPAVITTSLPIKTDKPIRFGAGDFCRTCKICAENCPSGAISHGDRERVRGYRRYRVNTSKCHNFWFSKLGNMGCRICVAVCPFTRKSNWLHRTALQVTANDPTGLSHRVLTGLQKQLYPGPAPQEYFMPSLGGSNASYREPPWWLKTEDFVDI